MWHLLSDPLKPSESRADLGDDRSLVERLRLGDVAALAALYDRHAGFVFGVACRELGDHDTSCEVLQRVFEHVWLHPEALQDASGSVCPALLVLTRTFAMDRGTADHLAPTRSDVHKEFSVLSPVERLALELAFFDGFSVTDIARQLDLPENVIDVRLRDALLKLREARARK